VLFQLKDLLEAAAAPVLSSDQRTHLQRYARLQAVYTRAYARSFVRVRALEAEAANTESSANARERRKLKRALERLQQTPEVQVQLNKRMGGAIRSRPPHAHAYIHV
jgi:hypothetical protein